MATMASLADDYDAQYVRYLRSHDAVSSVYLHSKHARDTISRSERDASNSALVFSVDLLDAKLLEDLQDEWKVFLQDDDPSEDEDLFPLSLEGTRLDLASGARCWSHVATLDGLRSRSIELREYVCRHTTTYVEPVMKLNEQQSDVIIKNRLVKKFMSKLTESRNLYDDATKLHRDDKLSKWFQSLEDLEVGHDPNPPIWWPTPSDTTEATTEATGTAKTASNTIGE